MTTRHQRIRRTIALLMASASGLGLTACGGGEEVASSDNATAGSPAAQQADLPQRKINLDYVYPAETMEELSTRSKVIATATATDAESTPGETPDLAYTRQGFELAEAFRGDIPQQFVVFLTGGTIQGPDGPVQLTDPENPQFESGVTYLLALTPHREDGESDNEWSVIGPSEGRYAIDDGRLVPLHGGDIQDRLEGMTPQEAFETIDAATSGS